MIKKIFVCFTLSLIFCLFLGSCGTERQDNKELSIVTTVFPQYDFSKKITEGTDSSVFMLIPAGSEAHSYDPTPEDIVRTAECDLFIWIGGESEAWAEKILNSTGLDKSRIITLMDVVPLLESTHENEGEHTHHLKEGQHDEHVWTSPKNAIKIVSAITEKLLIIDSKNAEIYRKNAEKYLSELVALDSAFENLTANTHERTLIFGDRFPFLYLAEAYGFSYASPFRGCSSQTEASMAEIAKVIEKAKELGAKTVFSVDFSNEKLAKTIADEIGGSVRRLYSCHVASKDDIENGNGYIELMRKNLESIREALVTQ